LGGGIRESLARRRPRSLAAQGGWLTRSPRLLAAVAGVAGGEALRQVGRILAERWGDVEAGRLDG
jgi:hypothetical protein